MIRVMLSVLFVGWLSLLASPPPGEWKKYVIDEAYCMKASYKSYSAPVAVYNNGMGQGSGTEGILFPSGTNVLDRADFTSVTMSSGPDRFSGSFLVTLNPAKRALYAIPSSKLTIQVSWVEFSRVNKNGGKELSISGTFFVVGGSGLYSKVAGTGFIRENSTIFLHGIEGVGGTVFFELADFNLRVKGDLEIYYDYSTSLPIPPPSPSPDWFPGPWPSANPE